MPNRAAGSKPFLRPGTPATTAVTLFGGRAGVLREPSRSDTAAGHQATTTA